MLQTDPHIYSSNILLYYILSFNFRQTQQYTNQLTHISLCIIEFIGHTMLLHIQYSTDAQQDAFLKD
jgi:hypothetical protein